MELPSGLEPGTTELLIPYNCFIVPLDAQVYDIRKSVLFF